MTIAKQRTEVRRYRRVADRYRTEGYEVIESPSQGQLPPWLGDYQVDLLAIGHEERVVVEFRSRDSLKGDSYLEQLAKVVSAHAGWRFELEVVNPSSQQQRVANSPPLGMRELGIRLKQARALAVRNVDAGFVMGWSGLEASLRRLAHKSDISVEGDAPAAMIKKLVMRGLVPRRDYDWLMRAVEVRNAIVHGLRETQTAAKYVGRVLRLADDIYRELSLEAKVPRAGRGRAK